MIKHEERQDGFVKYYNPQKPNKMILIYKDDIVAVAMVCREWHWGQYSASYRLGSGDYSYGTLVQAARDLEDICDEPEVADAVAELDTIIDKIERLEERIDQ
jgi:hypothetical protein